ncbi:MAG: type II secretion system F family protein [Lachnospiraceae bacterium]|nr:type II secretion system F family protein [Candidatus Merdinaster equi]
MSKIKKLTGLEVATFCEQMAIMMHAGISVREGLSILESDAQEDSAKELVHEIYECTLRGESLSTGLEKSGVFPEYVTRMVKMGEESGAVEVVLQSLADYYNRENAISEGAKSALRYPLIMIGMMSVVILVLIIRVLPIFNEVFKQLGSEITGFSRSMMDIGDVLKNYAAVFVGVIIVILVLVILGSKTEFGKRISRRFMTKFFLTKKLFMHMAVGRFASGMALARGGGLDVYRSLDMVAALVEHDELSRRALACKNHIKAGLDFAEAVKKEKIFSNLHSKMISVGTKAGEEDKVLKKIADNYEDETSDKLYAIVAVLEPTLVIVLSLIVGLILLSVILPLMGIMSTIG